MYARFGIKIRMYVEEEGDHKSVSIEFTISTTKMNFKSRVSDDLLLNTGNG